MSSSPDKPRGFYFDNDISMAAKAMVEMFEDEVEERVSERLEEVRKEGGNVAYWETLLDEIKKQGLTKTS